MIDKYKDPLESYYDSKEKEYISNLSVTSGVRFTKHGGIDVTNYDFKIDARGVLPKDILVRHSDTDVAVSFVRDGKPIFETKSFACVKSANAFIKDDFLYVVVEKGV